MKQQLCRIQDKLKRSRIREVVRGCLTIFILLALTFQLNPVNVAAISDAQRNALNSGVLYFNTEDSAVCGSTTTILTGNDNAQKAFNYFIQKGVTDYQSAGIVGNLMQESHVNPNAVQSNDVGHGIAQWSEPGRWDGVVNLAASKGVDPTDLGVQLDFMWQELSGTYASALSALKATTDVTDATQSFEQTYEAAGTPVMQNRISYAQQVLSTYGGSSASGTGSVCGVNCSGSDTSTSSLSPVRQSVVCIAEQELAAWTPPPAIPRTGFTKYTQGVVGTTSSPEEWCADFTSWVYNQAGYPLQPDPNWRLPAVASIQSVGQDNQNFHWHEAAGYTPKPGDIAIHGSQHVNIVVGVNGNQITLLGGDQGGGPYGGPDSASVVSEYTISSPTNDDPIITGYVSPD